MGRVFIYSGITFPFVIYYATEGDATLFVYEGWNFNSGNYLFKTDTK